MNLVFIVLSVFFGVGVVLLTIIGRSGDASQAGLDRYLFGQAATLVAGDVASMAVLGAVAIALVVLLYKELKVSTFDPAFARSLGFGGTGLDLVFTTLLVLAIAIGLQTVGVVLMAAMLIGPAVAARQWTDDLGRMLVLAAGFGAASGIVGARLSVSQERLPTGPVVILVMCVLLGVSLLVAPARGVAWQAWRRKRGRSRTSQTPLGAQASPPSATDERIAPDVVASHADRAPKADGERHVLLQVRGVAKAGRARGAPTLRCARQAARRHWGPLGSAV